MFSVNTVLTSKKSFKPKSLGAAMMFNSLLEAQNKIENYFENMRL